MKDQRDVLELVGVCAFFIILSVAGLVFAFVAQLGLSLDGLLLIICCLMMGGIFSLTLLSIAMEEGWLPGRKKAGEAKAPAAKASPAAGSTAVKSDEAVTK